MKFKILVAVLLVFGLIGVVYSASYMPETGIFAYKEVENYTLDGFNFTVPVSYNLTSQTNSSLSFKGFNDTLKINVVENGEIKQVNSTKNVTAGETMLGSQEGYLVERNGTYTFSYIEDEYLVRVSSKNMTLMMGVLGLD